MAHPKGPLKGLVGATLRLPSRGSIGFRASRGYVKARFKGFYRVRHCIGVLQFCLVQVLLKNSKLPW